jgi:hypothetical protein
MTYGYDYRFSGMRTLFSSFLDLDTRWAVTVAALIVSNTFDEERVLR